MLEQMIFLKDAREIKWLSDELSKIPCDIGLMAPYKRQTVNAKSPLGIMSLDLTEPLILKACTNNPELRDQIYSITKKLGRKEFYDATGKANDSEAAISGIRA